MEHYLDIDQLAPIFDNESVQFINLQYDDCSQELEWIEQTFPGKMINFSDIDQYNDLDSVAALMTCLDLVIAPATTVAELAGALGVPTWLFSNSSEIDWRKVNESCTDVWHRSMTIVDISEKGNKEALVKELNTKLKEFVNINV
jgi:capsular polysaccharide export protein